MMQRRIEITTIERERIVRVSGQLLCPESQKNEAKNIRRLFGEGITFLKLIYSTK
jgi:hypothetical protein